MKRTGFDIEQCGFLTTLQDLGRRGWLQYGVSRGGAMDQHAARLGNLLIINDENEAVLEITQSPHKILIQQDTLAAFTGGGLIPMINQVALPLNQPVLLPANAVLHCTGQAKGYRLYMAVAGGFKANVFLESAATNLLITSGGFEGRALKKGDHLQLAHEPNPSQVALQKLLKGGAEISLNLKPVITDVENILVLKGIEWSQLNESSKQLFTEKHFTISSQSNRMGYRLKGSTLQTIGNADIISSAVTQGTIQLTPSGEMILLMADAQTVGGYPRIAQVCMVSLSAIAQKKPGDEIKFKCIELAEAEELYLKEERFFMQLQSTMKSLLNH